MTTFSPIQRALMNNDNYIGITTFFLNKNIDDGTRKAFAQNIIYHFYNNFDLNMSQFLFYKYYNFYDKHLIWSEIVSKLIIKYPIYNNIIR